MITARDEKLMETLGAFGMLSTRQIAAMVFPRVRKTTLCRRLRFLEEKDKIRRLPGLPDGSLMWALTPKAASHVGVQAQIRRVNRNTLEHDLILADIRIGLSSAGLVISWVAEHELKHQAAKANYERRASIEHVPDAIITGKIRGEFRVVVLELERRVKSKRRYEELFREYLGDVPVWAVWYLVPNARIGQRLQAIWTEQSPLYRKTKFMWSTISDLMKNLPDATLHMDDGDYPLTAVLTP